MKVTKAMMGMTVSIEVVDTGVESADFENIFDYLKYVDEKFSTYKSESEISSINRGELKLEDTSPDMKLVFKLSEETNKLTDGYFDIKKPEGDYDPSGMVKGWAIWNCAQILLSEGFKNFSLDLGGDIQTYGKNEKGENWKIGIKNPLNQSEIIKVLSGENLAVATSGNYIRGDHIYNPNTKQYENGEIVSITVIGPNIYEADRFATAAFAMGREGINFIEKLVSFEGYMIDNEGKGFETRGFKKFEYDEMDR